MRFWMTSARVIPVVLVFASALQAESFSRKVDPWVLQKSAAGPAEFLVMLRTQGDLRGASALSAKAERGAFDAPSGAATPVGGVADAPYDLTPLALGRR